MNNKTKQMSTKQIIKELESIYDWMTIKKYKSKVDGKMKYRIDDDRFKPASCWKYELTESEMLEELKHHIERI